jgi:hypothetical protein
MSAEVGSLTSSVGEITKKISWMRDLLVAVIPSVVTVGLGFFIWSAQNGIEASQKEIEQSVYLGNQKLQAQIETQLKTQMALKEEFYKRRLTVYEEACKKVAGVKSALGEAGVSTKRASRAMDKLAELNDLNAGNPIYLSDGVEKRLGNLWMMGIHQVQSKAYDDDAVNTQIRSEILVLHKQMKDDLKSEAMSNVMQEPGK